MHETYSKYFHYDGKMIFCRLYVEIFKIEKLTKSHYENKFRLASMCTYHLVNAVFVSRENSH